MTETTGFKEVWKPITCKLCHYAGEYDLMKGEHDYLGDTVIVQCKQCSRKLYTRKPDEMMECLFEESE